MFLSLLNKYFLHSQDGIKNIKNIRNIKNIKMPKCFFFFFLQIFFKWWPSQQTAAWWFLKNIQTFATFSVLVQGVETIVLIWIQWWQKIYYDKQNIAGVWLRRLSARWAATTSLTSSSSPPPWMTVGSTARKPSFAGFWGKRFEISQSDPFLWRLIVLNVDRVLKNQALCF